MIVNSLSELFAHLQRVGLAVGMQKVNLRLYHCREQAGAYLKAPTSRVISWEIKPQTM